MVSPTCFVCVLRAYANNRALVALYVVLVIAATVQLFRMYVHKKNTKSSKPKALYLCILLQALSKCLHWCAHLRVTGS
jgi:hypothetical protein